VTTLFRNRLYLHLTLTLTFIPSLTYSFFPFQSFTLNSLYLATSRRLQSQSHLSRTSPRTIARPTSRGLYSRCLTRGRGGCRRRLRVSHLSAHSRVFERLHMGLIPLFMLPVLPLRPPFPVPNGLYCTEAQREFRS